MTTVAVSPSCRQSRGEEPVALGRATHRGDVLCGWWTRESVSKIIAESETDARCGVSVCKVCVGIDRSIDWVDRIDWCLGRTGARAVNCACDRSIDRSSGPGGVQQSGAAMGIRAHIDETTRAARGLSSSHNAMHRSIETSGRTRHAWGRSGRGWHEQGQQAGVGAAAGQASSTGTARDANHHLSFTAACGGRQRQARRQAPTTEVRRMWVGGCWLNGIRGVGGGGKSDDSSSFHTYHLHNVHPTYTIDRQAGQEGDERHRELRRTGEQPNSPRHYVCDGGRLQRRGPGRARRWRQQALGQRRDGLLLVHEAAGRVRQGDHLHVPAQRGGAGLVQGQSVSWSHQLRFSPSLPLSESYGRSFHHTYIPPPLPIKRQVCPAWAAGDQCAMDCPLRHPSGSPHTWAAQLAASAAAAGAGDSTGGGGGGGAAPVCKYVGLLFWGIRVCVCGLEERPWDAKSIPTRTHQPPLSPPHTRPSIPRFYTSGGGCRWGDKCKFRHPEGEEGAPGSLHQAAVRDLILCDVCDFLWFPCVCDM